MRGKAYVVLQGDMVKEARPQKHTYVCSEERTVVLHVVLMRTEVSSSDLCTIKESYRGQTAHVGE